VTTIDQTVRARTVTERAKHLLDLLDTKHLTVVVGHPNTFDRDRGRWDAEPAAFVIADRLGRHDLKDLVHVAIGGHSIDARSTAAVRLLDLLAATHEKEPSS
jgi:hypothetical protein